MYKKILFVIVVLIAAIQCEQKRFQQQMLTAHNKFRKRHCVSSLRLDDNLSRSAQRYAEFLARTNTFKHSGTKGVGENLHLMSSSRKIINVDGARATQSWYDEVKFYNYAKGLFSKKTGHFTRVIWKSSQKLGVGYAYSKDHRKVYVVAQYSPPGNVLGQFTKNVLRPKC